MTEKMIGFFPAKFLSATEFFLKQCSEMYRRSLKTDLPEKLLYWYNRKNIYLVSNNQIKGNSMEKELISEMRQGFMAAAPFYAYLCGVAE